MVISVSTILQSVLPGNAVNASPVTSGLYYPVFVGAAGTTQVPNVRTAATAFTYNASTNTLTVSSTSAQYADIAEQYVADTNYEPGTVVEFGGNEEVKITSVDMTPKVAGVITTNPAFLMNNLLQGNTVVAVALQGRVPTKVVGPVGKGDMMVATADGRARSEPNPRVGSVIGKSLEDFTATPDNPESTIEVVIGKH